jgi:hypothetical protein
MSKGSEGHTVSGVKRVWYRLCAVRDPAHVRKHLAQELGEPMFTQEVGRIGKPEGISQWGTGMGSRTVA